MVTDDRRRVIFPPGQAHQICRVGLFRLLENDPDVVAIKTAVKRTKTIRHLASPEGTTSRSSK